LVVKLLVCSLDGAFLRRMTPTLDTDERITIVPRHSDALALTRASVFDLIVMDLRGMPRDDALGSLATVRTVTSNSTRIVAVTTLDVPRGLEVVTRAGRYDIDVLLADKDPVPEMIRGMACDQSRTSAAAEILHMLRRGLKPHAAALATLVLSCGCKISNVDQAARALSVSADTLEIRHAGEGSPAPKLIIVLTLCCYAAALFRRGGTTWKELAHWTRYSKGRTLRDNMKKCFGANLMRLRWERPGEPVSTILGPLVQAWREAHSAKPKPPNPRKQAVGAPHLRIPMQAT